MNTLLGIVLVLAGAAERAPVDVHVTLAPPEIPFHKQTQFTIVAEAFANVEVQLPDMKGKFGELAIYGAPTQKVEKLENGRRRFSVSYTLDPVKIGEYPISPVEVTWPGGRVVAPSPALRVRDLTPAEKADVEQFLPIVGPRSAPRPFWRYWQVWASLLAFVAAALLLWMYMRRRQIAAPGAPHAPRLPWETAFARLRGLEDSNLIESGEWGPFYIELSAILRQYIEDRYRLHAPEQTTPEFLAEAARSGVFTGEHQKLLAGVLRQSDRVKFALHEPTAEDMRLSFSEVRRFVEDSVPKPQPVAEEAAA